jgi:3',5'-cyclic AMP phosphodiesterase CpdA
MGLRFDLNTVNWLAYLLQPGAVVPRFSEPTMEKMALQAFLGKLEHRFHSSLRREMEFAEYVHRAQRLLDEVQYREGEVPAVILTELRRDLGDRPWTALIVPAGDDWKLDDFLSSEDLMMRLVGLRSEEPGLLLQLDSAPSEPFALTDVFPAFRVALASATRWPGILVWSRSADAAFFPFDSRNSETIEERARFLLHHLSQGLGADLESLQRLYSREVLGGRSAGRRTHFLHLSDLHIGSKEASRRLPRVQQLIRNLLVELEGQGDATIIPVVSGDLMDSPTEDFLDRVRAFLNFLNDLGTEDPFIVLGNHDVRQDGFLSEQLRQALQIPLTRLRVMECDQLAIVGFNSVISGKLARGFIGERQMIDVGNELDRVPAKCTVIGVVHHHPTPVEIPEWYLRPFYERVLGGKFDKTDELEDAEIFVKYLESRSFAAVLHGHKHIPRIDKTPERGIPIYGCGSSVGKVPTKDGATYMSLNVITIDLGASKISGRLLGERLPGAGLVEERRHEVVHRGSLTAGRELG